MEFKQYMKDLKRVMLGESFPDSKDFVTLEVLSLISEKVDINI